MEQLPLISVIVPVYRVEQYLDKCVSSILSQTYDNLELILVDDGSPDRSGEICDRWAEADSRVRVIHQKNAGGGAARNAGLDVARGQLIGFVDSDDYISPDMYAHLYSLLLQGADIAECAHVMTEDNGADFVSTEGQPRWYDTGEAMACHIWDTVFQQVIWNKLYRREMVGQIRFPEGTRIDDEFFTYQVLGNAERLVRSEKVCYAYRQQVGSVMHQRNPVKKLEGLRAKQQRLEWIQGHIPELVQQAKIELGFSCIYALQVWLREPAGDIRKAAMEEIRKILRLLQPIEFTAGESAKRRLLIMAAGKCPVAVAKVLNLLTDIHILT